jgi:hypothetical protein
MHKPKGMPKARAPYGLPECPGRPGSFCWPLKVSPGRHSSRRRRPPEARWTTAGWKQRARTALVPRQPISPQLELPHQNTNCRLTPKSTRPKKLRLTPCRILSATSARPEEHCILSSGELRATANSTQRDGEHQDRKAAIWIRNATPSSQGISQTTALRSQRVDPMQVLESGEIAVAGAERQSVLDQRRGEMRMRDRFGSATETARQARKNGSMHPTRAGTQTHSQSSHSSRWRHAADTDTGRSKTLAFVTRRIKANRLSHGNPTRRVSAQLAIQPISPPLVPVRVKIGSVD